MSLKSCLKQLICICSIFMLITPIYAVGTTVIDVQTIQTGGSVGCQHIYEAKYDSNYHWEQCWKCGNIINKAAHNLINDSGVSNTCQQAIPNVLLKCNGLDGKCQYYETLEKPQHTLGSQIILDPSEMQHIRICDQCKASIGETCRKSDKTIPGCGNPGQCVICKYNYGTSHGSLGLYDSSLQTHQGVWNSVNSRSHTYNVQCIACREQFGTVELQEYRDLQDIQGRTTTYKWKFNLNPGVEIDAGSGEQYDRLSPIGYSGTLVKGSYDLYDYKQQGTVGQHIYLLQTVDENTVIGNLHSPRIKLSGQFILQTTIRSLPDAYSIKDTFELRMTNGWTLNGQPQLGWVQTRWIQYPDTVSPYYVQNQANTVASGSVNKVVDGAQWQNKATIQIEFYDTLMQTGYRETDGFIRFYDKDMTPLTAWEPVVKNEYYNNFQKFYKQKDIVAEIKGTQPVYVQCKDKIGNISETVPVQVQNIDAVAPQITNQNILQTPTNWSKYKDIQYNFTDKGTGHVKVQFNSDSDSMDAQDKNQVDYYQEANLVQTDTYQRSYRFTGNVSGRVGATLYVKDALDNTREYRVNIYNLDNTAPTIQKCETVKDEYNTYIDIVSEHDNFETGEPGSGVQKHLIKYVKASQVNTPQIPQSPQESDDGWIDQQKIQVYESGWYFVYAMDAVGNISEPYIIYVNASIITYDSNGGNPIDEAVDGLIIVDNLDIFNPINLRGKEFERDGYQTFGWNTEVDGSGKHYDFNETVQFTASTTLYADWIPNHLLVVDLNGGTNTDDYDYSTKNGDRLEFILSEGEQINIPDPLREGYNFSHWILDKVE